MDDIIIPMIRGNMDDIDEDVASFQTDGDAEAPNEHSSGHSSRLIYEREAQIKIDYSNLSDEMREVRFMKIP